MSALSMSLLLTTWPKFRCSVFIHQVVSMLALYPAFFDWHILWLIHVTTLQPPIKVVHGLLLTFHAVCKPLPFGLLPQGWHRPECWFPCQFECCNVSQKVLEDALWLDLVITCITHWAYNLAFELLIVHSFYTWTASFGICGCCYESWGDCRYLDQAMWIKKLHIGCWYIYVHRLYGTTQDGRGIIIAAGCSN